MGDDAVDEHFGKDRLSCFQCGVYRFMCKGGAKVDMDFSVRQF